jgi:hypothetical protein
MTTIRELMGRITQAPWCSEHVGRGWGIVAREPMRGRIDSQIAGMKEDDARAIAILPELLALAAAVEELHAVKNGDDIVGLYVRIDAAYARVSTALAALQAKLEAK